MTSVLLMRFAGPLQSWGVESRFDRRNTERAPTKSAVIGLLASALGRSRDDSIDDLRDLKFGVRLDQQGRRMTDFHIAQGRKSSYVTYRDYLSDAIFLVGVEGPEELIQKLVIAVQSPYYPLFLGRRSCPPEGKVVLGIRQNKSLLEALSEEPWLGSIKQVKRPDNLRLIIEAKGNESNVGWLKDEPISFSKEHRQYEYRPYAERMIAFPLAESTEAQTLHDPLELMGGE